VAQKILLFITDAGGGHRASALSLKAACETASLPYEVEVVNVYRSMWRKAEPLGRLTGVYGEDVYNFTLKHSLLAPASALRAVARWAANTPNRRAYQDGLAYVRAERPALCVSLMPFVNDTLARICREAEVPFTLIMTDLVDLTPFMWYTPLACAEAAWVAAPCGEAAEQARSVGASKILSSGLLLHPKYFAPSYLGSSRAEIRQRLGLDADAFTVLLSMGGFGGSALEDLVEGLESRGDRWQIVVACGRNAALRERLLRRKPGRHKVVPLGFTQDLHLYLRAADLMAGKPGPASLFEAVAARTPLVLDAAAVMPQERPNADLAARNGLALAVRRRSELPDALAALAADPQRRRAMVAAQEAYALPDAGAVLAQAVAETAHQGGRAAVQPRPVGAHPAFQGA
jgi:hypothetical protein